MKLISTRHKPWVVYAAFSLFSLSMMTSNLRGGRIADYIEKNLLQLLSPVYRSVDWVCDRTVSIWHGYIDLVNVREENRYLKETIQALQQEHLLLVDKALSADRLQSLISSSYQSNQANVRAKVIRRGNTLLNPTFLIAAGTRNGLREGSGVAATNGVLGQIIRVGPDISKVLTLHHPETGIGAMLQQSRVQGVVSGTASGHCIMRYVSRFDRVVLGESVVTSGLDGAFPKGIPIGRVVAIKRDTNEIFQRLEILTDVNINTAEEVLVYLMPEPDTSSDPDLDPAEAEPVVSEQTGTL